MSSRRALVADLIASSCVDGPGNRFVVFLQGCNFDCLACHNPHTIPFAAERAVDTPVALAGEPDGDADGGRACPAARWMSVDAIVDRIREAAPFVSGVTVSGGEATVQWRAVVDLFGALAADPDLAHLSRFVDSNGDASQLVWDALAPTMDAAMIDLKAIDPEVHAFLTGRSNARVLATIRHLARLGKLHEVRLLIVPGVNDRAAHIAKTARRLAAIDPDIAVRVLGFRHHGTRECADPFHDAEPERLARVADQLVEHGIRRDRITVWPPVTSLAR